MKKFWAFVKKEFWHILRDKRTLLILIGMPLAQVLIFGYAITNEFRDASIVILHQSKGKMSQELTHKLLASGHLKLAGQTENFQDIDSYFKKGTVKLVRDLPLGWKQRLAFSVALFHEPGLVFLDEPTGGVGPITRRQFWEMIYKAANDGVTVFVTTHYMDEAEYCDRVSIMVAGRIEAMDSPAGLKKTYDANSMDEVFLKLARG